VDCSQGLATVAVGPFWVLRSVTVPKDARKHSETSRTVGIVVEEPLLEIILTPRYSKISRINKQCFQMIIPLLRW
jgi:hypothetical protein